MTIVGLMIQGLPPLFLALLVLCLVVGLSGVPFAIAGSVVQASTQLVAYTHVKLHNN